MNAEEMMNRRCPVCGCRMKTSMCMNDAPLTDPYYTVRARIVYDCRGCGFVGSRAVSVEDPDSMMCVLNDIVDHLTRGRRELEDADAKLDMVGRTGLFIWAESEDLSRAMHNLDSVIESLTYLVKGERKKAAEQVKAKVEEMNEKMKEEEE